LVFGGGKMMSVGVVIVGRHHRSADVVGASASVGRQGSLPSFLSLSVLDPMKKNFARRP
jgi:hypothetical protein